MTPRGLGSGDDVLVTWPSRSSRSCSPTSSAPLRSSSGAATRRRMRFDDGISRCCAAPSRSTAAADGGLELRVGLEAGEPLSEGDDLYGTPVIIASRLCDIAGAGEILASEVVCKIAGPRVSELIQPVGTLKLRGTGERVAAAQVRWRDGLQTASADPQ